MLRRISVSPYPASRRRFPDGGPGSCCAGPSGLHQHVGRSRAHCILGNRRVFQSGPSTATGVQTAGPRIRSQVSGHPGRAYARSQQEEIVPRIARLGRFPRSRQCPRPCRLVYRRKGRSRSGDGLDQLRRLGIVPDGARLVADGMAARNLFRHFQPSSQKVLPVPRVLGTGLPSIICKCGRVVASPPVPPAATGRRPSACSGTLNNRESCSSVTPTPVSSTSKPDQELSAGLANQRARAARWRRAR